MFTSISRKTQTAVCMILSAVIVSAGLSLGAFAAEHAAAPRRLLGHDHADSVNPAPCRRRLSRHAGRLWLSPTVGRA